MILPDTHTLLWYMALNPRLGTQAERRILRSRILGEVAFSAISVWEVALLLAKGRLTLNISAIQWRQNLLDSGFIKFPLTAQSPLVPLP